MITAAIFDKDGRKMIPALPPPGGVSGKCSCNSASAIINPFEIRRCGKVPEF